MDKYQYLIFDGSYLHQQVGLVAVMTGGSNTIISGKYAVKETTEQQLSPFFQSLKDLGLKPFSFTVDGNPLVIKVLNRLWPEIIIQRCLVHIQRQGLMWCRSYPKTSYARKLRNIFLKVTNIRTSSERDQFLEIINQWETHYGQYLVTRPERGRVFSDIKRARSMLIKALPDMFHYLDNPNIPFSTNGIEGYFSRLKSHYRQHRGLANLKLNNYFNWYFFLRPK